MVALSGLLGDLVADAGGLFLFILSSSHYEQFAETDVPTVIIASGNTVETEMFVELSLQFQNVKDRIRFGVEGTTERSVIETGDTIACDVGTFGGDPDSLIRAHVEESIRSGTHDLFANSRADPSVIRDAFEVAAELGKKGQKGEPVGVLFIVNDTGKVMNKPRPLSYNPFERSHVYIGDLTVNVMLKEFSQLDDAFVISDSGKVVSAYRRLEPSTGGVDTPEELGTHHMAGGTITRDTSTMATALSESDGFVRAFKGGKMILEIDPGVY